MNWSEENTSSSLKKVHSALLKRNKPGTSQCRVFTSRKGRLLMALPMSHREEGGVRNMANSLKAKNEDGELIFCRFIVKNGVRIYPKHGKVFCFRVKN